ncbi:hypothetical protein JQS43_20245 [Natronosporangium hydrolyticum]|uniref:Uncharacterized protein n=1 Tax=Natronosporangium hydrolyticum TaxID=2811111 RepID=A0A895YJA5_9ACTN|nr:hypothetical protein [Natronosporangium hydrolyticum]QSB13858.1 hypothetical protein JQS43_20245 [Natronosporangium hydrolyticum]
MSNATALRCRAGTVSCDTSGGGGCVPPVLVSKDRRFGGSADPAPMAGTA